MPRPPLQITTAGRSAPKAARIKASDLPEGTIHLPGSPGYNGQGYQGGPPSTKGRGSRDKDRAAWQRKAHFENDMERTHERWDAADLNVGRAAMIAGGGLATLGVGGGVGMNALHSRRARQIKAGQRDKQLLRKAWEPSMPFVRTARKTGKVHDVTSMPKPLSDEERLARWASGPKTADLIVGGGATLGAAGWGIGASRGKHKVRRAETQRKVQLAREGALNKRAGTEFNRGGTYERYSGESTRGRVTAEGAALGGVALGAGAASSSLAGAKLAGTPLGQTALQSVQNKLELTGRKSPQHKLAAEQVGRYKKYGAWAGKNKLKATGGLLAASGVAGLARIGQKARQNEEAGISQGIGRMKAGEHYSGVQRRATFGKVAGVAPLALATDVLTHPRFGPMAQKFVENKGKITAAGIGAAGVGGLVTTARVSQKHTKEYHKLRGELKPTGKVIASKGGPQFALAGLLTGGAGLGTGAGLKHHHEEQKGREVQAATIGGWAGQGVYQGAGYGAKHVDLHHLGPKTTKSQRNNALKEVKAKHGAFTPAMERNYPLKTKAGVPIPGAKIHRVLGWTHRGKTGTALGAGATAAGSAVGAKMVSNKGPNGHGKREHVEKLYVRDQQTSMPHLIGAAAGLGLGAWGFGRSRMVGAALSRGISMARSRNSTAAVDALQAAQSLQGILRRGTAPGERALRQIGSVDRMVSRVPSALRPEIALAAGTLLVGHSRPIRRDTYHPVRLNIRTHGGF